MATRTVKDQKEVEKAFKKECKRLEDEDANPYLYREEHVYYLYKSLTGLKHYIRYYDVGHPWIFYWVLHGMCLLDDERFRQTELQTKILDFLRQCQHPSGGFCGGNGQFPQVASTYAALLSLFMIGTQEAYDMIDRQKMYDFFLKIKNPDGSFRMGEKGEIDMRGSYIVVIMSSILGIQTPELMDGVADYIAKCQTYEGGIGPVVNSEAHGGLTYCAIAALCELKQLHKINVQKLISWSVNRQMVLEGGYQGRTNKLVDNCYSFWQGCIPNLLAQYSKGDISFNNHLINNQEKLQLYCLICQNEDGGLIDKLGKPVDLYHTCYALSGLSLSQKKPQVYKQEYKESEPEEQNLIWNAEENKLKDTDPIYNINPEHVKKAREYFQSNPITIQQK